MQTLLPRYQSKAPQPHDKAWYIAGTDNGGRLRVRRRDHRIAITYNNDYMFKCKTKSKEVFLRSKMIWSTMVRIELPFSISPIVSSFRVVTTS